MTGRKKYIFDIFMKDKELAHFATSPPKYFKLELKTIIQKRIILTPLNTNYYSLKAKICSTQILTQR